MDHRCSGEEGVLVTERGEREKVRERREHTGNQTRAHFLKGID